MWGHHVGQVGHVSQRAGGGAGGKVGVNIRSRLMGWLHRPGLCTGVVIVGDVLGHHVGVVGVVLGSSRKRCWGGFGVIRWSCGLKGGCG